MVRLFKGMKGLKEFMKDLYTFIICLLVVCVSLYVCYTLSIGQNTTDASLRGQAFGGLMGLCGSAMGYWVASSKSSAEKDKIIADSMKNPNNQISNNSSLEPKTEPKVDPLKENQNAQK